MANGPVIELDSLPSRHPKTGAAFLKQCAAACVLRLSMDPTQLPAGIKVREIVVDRLTPGTAREPWQDLRLLGWGGTTGVSEDDCVRLSITFNERRITEDAALAIMALLIHELEGLTVERVLPIGSGGDYLLSMRRWGKPTQVEVSGIREDLSGRRSRSRLAEKREQVPAGFASVTTFSRQGASGVHSYLHYVEKLPLRGTKKGKGKGRKGRK